MPFQNKQCCWSSPSWDSLLKNSSLLLPSLGQYQTNINNCGTDVLTGEDSKAGLKRIPHQNKAPTTEINLLVWVLWDKSTFWILSRVFIEQPLEGFLFVCLFEARVKKFFHFVIPSVRQMLMLGAWILGKGNRNPFCSLLQFLNKMISLSPFKILMEDIKKSL